MHRTRPHQNFEMGNLKMKLCQYPFNKHTKFRACIFGVGGGGLCSTSGSTVALILFQNDCKIFFLENEVNSHPIAVCLICQSDTFHRKSKIRVFLWCVTLNSGYSAWVRENCNTPLKMKVLLDVFCLKTRDFDPLAPLQLKNLSPVFRWLIDSEIDGITCWCLNVLI